MLVLTAFGQFLGQQNITNAYVSGMKEDLNAQGNELNYFVVACMSDTPICTRCSMLTIQTTPHMS
jgi:ACS family pantothenate transporter-like MFS transporter